MKLLILTQKVDINDDILGFMHGWIAEFAKKCEQVTVIALAVGEHSLPGNVKVMSLGKETGGSKLKYLFNFYKYIFQERKNYDAVLVHMNKEYIILGGLIWRLLGKKVGLWYVHKKVSCQLKLAEKISNAIFTAAKESFGLSSQKLTIIGHGIDINKFYYNPKEKNDDVFKIIYVGRISKIKNQKLLIEAVDILNRRGVINIKVNFIGAPIYKEDFKYRQELIDLIETYKLEKYFNFTGGLPHKNIAASYRQADLSVNLCPTGGMDKAVLESMAVGLPVIVYNKAFAPLIGQFNNLTLENLNKEELADKIIGLMKLEAKDRNLIGQKLNKIIFKHYNLAGLADKIISGLSRQ